MNAEEATSTPVVHCGITCDRSGMSPIVGKRYHKTDEDYDLCEEEFQKITDEVERSRYELVTRPRALSTAEYLLETDSPQDTAEALAIAESILKPLVGFDRLAIARAACIKGSVLLEPLLAQLKSEQEESPTVDDFARPWELFTLAAGMDPDNDEAVYHVDSLRHLMERPDISTGEQGQGEPNHAAPLDVIVIGAGAAGVGISLMLTRVFGLETSRVQLIERGDSVGETFERWPKEMRFISPSFNQQGWTGSFDLNSVAYGTSPAYTLHAEHPTGEQYAKYLRAISEAAKLNVRTNTEATAVRALVVGEDSGFEVDIVETKSNTVSKLRSRFVVWAAGEFQYPQIQDHFPGSAEFCLHNSAISSWAQVSGDDFVVIGGYESGMDAACSLSSYKKRCTVVSATAHWNVTDADPSIELAPRTAERIRSALNSSTPPQLVAPFRVCDVKSDSSGNYIVTAKRVKKQKTTKNMNRVQLPVVTKSCDPGSSSDEITLITPHKPLLCTGFGGSVRLGVAATLFGVVPPKTSMEVGDEAEVGDNSGIALKKARVEAVVGDNPGIVSEYATVAVEAGNNTHCNALDEEATAEGEITARQQTEGDTDTAPPFRGADKKSKTKAEFLNEYDESVTTPGLFLVGPGVQHEDLSFCFVYKFRQRFAVVADAIAQRLGFRTADAVKDCRAMDMYLDDFSCCKGACGETC